VRVESGVPGPLPILGLSVAAERDEAGPQQGAVCPQRARDLVPIHVRQPEVAQDHVRLQLQRRRHTRRAVVRDAGVVAVERQDFGERLGRIDAVLDDEHQARRRAG
jgi:hypothetical protein